MLRYPYDNAIWATVLVGSIPLFGFAIYLLGSPDSQATKALAGLALFWLSLLWVLTAGLYWPLLERMYQKAQPWFVGIGVSITVVLLVEVSLRLYDLAFERADAPVEASTDTRILGEGDVPWASAYWAEFKVSAHMQWTPYLYWRRQPFVGEFINVDERGVRRTLSPDDPADVRVFFFGGSTAWGTGARDMHTIPSELVDLLAEQGISAEITNFAESGYVSRQDSMLFRYQLQQGNVPDVAIFYWGYNDTCTAWRSGFIGLPANEGNRVAEFDFGRRANWTLPPGAAFVSLAYDTALGARLLPWWGIPDIKLDNTAIDTSVLGRLEDANLALTTFPGQSPSDVADYFVITVNYVTHLAELYGVEVVFVWHPVPYLKYPLCSYEQQSLEEFLNAHRGLDHFYVAVDASVRDRVKTFDKNVLVMSDLFAGHTECVFMDYVHITEAGNRTVAARIVPYLISIQEPDR